MTFHCERCGEELTEDRTIWLDLDFVTGLYSEERAQNSQGCFPFGATCAKRVLDNGGRLKRIKEAAR